MGNDPFPPGFRPLGPFDSGEHLFQQRGIRPNLEPRFPGCEPILPSRIRLPESLEGFFSVGSVGVFKAQSQLLGR